VTCSKCGTVPTASGCGTGYGKTADGSILCYACCALADIESMKETGKIWLYLSKGYVTNWPGTLKFKAINIWTKDHNWRDCKQIFIHFIGPDNCLWTGRSVNAKYGWSEVVRCKRLKPTGRAAKEFWATLTGRLAAQL
jgi:hypothetical protein